MIDIFREWNPWWDGAYKFQGISRDKLKEILLWLKRREIIAIVGARRAGKTTILSEMISHLINTLKVSPKEIFFIKADDDRIYSQSTIDSLIAEYCQSINPSRNFYLFIDEIQVLDSWHTTLKRIYDVNTEIKIFITGSNAQVLKDDVSSKLAGRFAYFEIFPFSFKEFLSAKNILIAPKNISLIIKSLKEYAQTGGFPEVALEKQEFIKKNLLNFYFDTIFYRDVIRRGIVRNPKQMEQLAKYLLQNVSNLTNSSRIARIIGLTSDSVSEYLILLEDAYLLFPMAKLEYSYKKQIMNPKKIYCVDTGIRNLAGFKFSEDLGRLYENIVYMHLRRQTKEIYYWGDKHECDFAIKSEKLQLIQVTINDSKRELDGLIEAAKHFKTRAGIILTENISKSIIIDGITINYIPLWKWLTNSS